MLGERFGGESISLRVSILASGSSGNCTLLETSRTRLLVDAGLGKRETLRRLAAYRAVTDDFIAKAGGDGVNDRNPKLQRKRRTSMLLLLIFLVLLFGGGGGYYGYSRWGTGGGLGIVGAVLVIVLIVYLLGGLR